MKRVFDFLRNEVFLGTMIALLSVLTAFSSYQGAMADSEQNKYEIKGMQALNDGNAEYLSANQNWIQDEGNYDNWYINNQSNPEVAEYYEGNFSQSLFDAIARNGDDYPMDEQYSDELYVDAIAYWDDADYNFDLGSQWDERGDQLQLVMLIMALGLALTAWASLLHAESKMRGFFALLGLVALIAGLAIYFVMVSTVVA